MSGEEKQAQGEGAGKAPQTQTPLEALSASLSQHRIPFDSVALDCSRAYWELAQEASRLARQLRQCDSERIALLPLKTESAALKLEVQRLTEERALALRNLEADHLPALSLAAAAKTCMDGLKTAGHNVATLRKLLSESEAKVVSLTAEKVAKASRAGNAVNHPSHYNQGGIECIDAIASATASLSGNEAFCTGNAIKYLWRWKQKAGGTDLEKARWYIDRLLADLSRESGK